MLSKNRISKEINKVMQLREEHETRYLIGYEDALRWAKKRTDPQTEKTQNVLAEAVMALGKNTKFITTLQKLEGTPKKPVSRTRFVKALTKDGFGKEEAERYITKHLKGASIYQSKLTKTTEYYNVV